MPNVTQRIRDEFDLDPGLIYLNSGTHSLCPREVLEAVTRYQREYERNPTEALVTAWPRVWESQKLLGRFLNAKPTDLLLRVNVTHAMNDAILGLPLERGGEILVTDLEYGAVVDNCRFRAERNGLTLRTLHLPLEATESELAGLFAASLTDKTRLVVVSHVCSGTGHTLPIQAIAQATRARGAFLAVDGAHAPGAMPLDFAQLGDVDFYGGNLHKWVMGPKGTAFAWFNPRVQEKLAPLMAGWPTFEKPEYYGGFGGGSRFAERFAMLGCHDFAPFFAIAEALAFWDRHGAEALRARIAELQSAAESAMAPVGWKRLSPAPGLLRGPLLTYDLPDSLQAPGGQTLMRDILAKAKVQVSITSVQGRWALRLSPHVYNTEEEIAQAAARLLAYSKTA